MKYLSMLPPTTPSTGLVGEGGDLIFRKFKNCTSWEVNTEESPNMYLSPRPGLQ